MVTSSSLWFDSRQSQPRHSWREVWQQAHLRRPCMSVVLFLVSQRIGIWKLVKLVILDTTVLFRAIMHLFSHSSSIVLCCGYQLLNVTFNFSSARCIRWPDFALIRCFCHCVMNFMLLNCACCTRLIRNRIIVRLGSFHLFLSKFVISGVWLLLIHWSLKC